MPVSESHNRPAPLHGLLCWLEETRIALPLKGVEAAFTVHGDLASVQLDQIYHQDRDRVLDVTYTFPLPAGAAVFRCELHVNGRMIAAKVEEAEEAKRLAREMKAAGHRTVVVDQVRENLFELELGNLAPGDTVVVRLCWIVTLERTGREWALRIPFCPGVRYIPGSPLLRRNSGTGTADDTDAVPDASRLSPPRIDALHSDAAYVSISGKVDLATADAAALASPSHTLMLRERGGNTEVSLGDRAAVPDRDFVLRGEDIAGKATKQAAWIAQDDLGCHALLRVVAPTEAESSDDAAQDVYFLVDRSGSMDGVKWTATCQAVRTFLKNLAPQDRAWITWFETGFQDMAEKPLPPAALLADPAIGNLEKWGTGGGTELLPALKHVLAKIDKCSRSRRVVIVLITDGQVGNEAEVLEVMKQHPERRLFTFGIDTVVNDAFLRRLAGQQRGACHLATPNDNLVAPIAGLAMKLRRPILIDLAPGPGWEMPSALPPDLLAGEALSISLRRVENGAPLILTARLANGEDGRMEFEAAVEPHAMSGIGHLWAKQRIDWLIEAGKSAEAIALAKATNLICAGTAFIAWDEAERIAIRGSAVPVYQPAMIPESWAGGSFYSAAAPASFSRALKLATNADLEAALGEVPYPDRAPIAPGSGGSVGRSLKQRARSITQRLFSRDLTDAAAPQPSPKPVRAENPLEPVLTRLQALSPESGASWSAELCEWLEQWVLSEPSLSRKRTRALEDLIKKLISLAENQRTAALRAWIERTFASQPAFLRGCLAAVAVS